MKLPNFVSKIGHDFGNKVVQKLTISISNKQLFFNEKKIQKDSDDF